jgi:cobalt transporter subunit CbtA
MMIRVLLAALVAGVLAGGFATAAQQVRVVPLILAAETYESGDAGHSHDAAAGAAAQSRENAEESWAPADGIERTLYTTGANALVGVAFSLILTAGILLSRQAIGLSSGLVWGAAGFVAFVLAPNFGLPPELPGMAAADLPARQGWWAATVALTAAGLWIFAFRRGIGWMAAGVALVLAMHVVGAPQPEAHESAVPANLAAEFAVATIVTSAAFWVVLGGLLGYALNRAMSAEAATG